MAVPSSKYGTENREDLTGKLVQVDQLAVGAVGSTKTASATAGAATLNSPSGVVTSESITTAAAATYTLTLTNSCIAATDIVLVSQGNGTNTQGAPVIQSITPAAGSVVVVVKNVHASQALNGTLTFSFVIVKV
jgi:hypothetical protein